jgi:hypothetical protein
MQNVLNGINIEDMDYILLKTRKQLQNKPEVPFNKLQVLFF